MTLVALNTTLKWPGYTPAASGASLSTWATLDAAGEYTSYIFTAREDMVVSHVGWRTGTVAGAPTADTRIETVAADGTPSGTLWAANTNIVSGTLTSDTWTLHALTASATITKGQIVCIKIVYNSGTSIIAQRFLGTRLGAITDLPYQVSNTTGSVVKSGVNGAPLIALGSSTSAFYQVDGVIAAIAITSNVFNNTNSAARGLRFQVPFPCRCVGISAILAASVGDLSVVLYDDAGAELSSSSTAFDGNHNNGTGNGPSIIYFDNTVSLAKDTWYRVALVPSSATNVGIATVQLPSANYRSGTPGGTNHHYATRASGTWTDTATDTVPLLDILIDQLDDGAGAGASGMLVHPGMNGRLV